jgi:hypothetical protein
MSENYALEKMPFLHCPYCEYSVLGGVPDEADTNMRQHIKEKHPSKQGRLDKLTAKLKMSEFLNWELPQWFCPVWCELPSWRFCITSITTTLITFWLTKSTLITAGWIIGLQIFGWTLAFKLGVLDHD